MKGGAKVIIEAHRHEGVFIARSKEDALVTLNSTPGKDVYGEKRIQVEGPVGADGNATKLEYRVWNPFRSKLAAAILGGVDNIYMAPGMKVLYLGASAGTTVSHVSDILGPTGTVYAVEFAHRPGRDLINMAKSRTNVIPIIEDARHPLKYRYIIRIYMHVHYRHKYTCTILILSYIYQIYLADIFVLLTYNTYTYTCTKHTIYT